MDKQEKRDTFDFIVKRAQEVEYQPEFIKKNAVVQTLGIQKQKEELQQEKKEWVEYCERKRKEEDPIERYCYEIRGELPDYEMTFEQYKKDAERVWQVREDAAKKEEEQNTMDMRPEKMTDKEWIKMRSKRIRLQREEKKEQESDEKLERQSPFYLFLCEVNKIGCRCKAEEMRRGKFCDTCKLIVRVHENMQELFKNASQGRATL
jgi:hypothetical protein